MSCIPSALLTPEHTFEGVGSQNPSGAGQALGFSAGPRSGRTWRTSRLPTGRRFGHVGGDVGGIRRTQTKKPKDFRFHVNTKKPWLRRWFPGAKWISSVHSMGEPRFKSDAITYQHHEPLGMLGCESQAAGGRSFKPTDPPRFSPKLAVSLEPSDGSTWGTHCRDSGPLSSLERPTRRN